MPAPTCTKIGYPSPQAAHDALTQMRRRERGGGRGRRRRAKGGGDRVYKCRPCNAWHVTRGEWGSLTDLPRGA